MLREKYVFRTSGSSLIGTMNLSSPAPVSALVPFNTTEHNIFNDIIHNRAVQVLFCTVYTGIFALGVFGNVLVCYVVGRNRAMQTVTNLFITNLALSDILLCVLCVPFTPLYTFLGTWVFGGTLCHVVAFAQGTSVYISTLTLTSIAVDRFFVIVYPFKPRMRLSTCVAIICSIWLFSLVVTLPYGVYTVLRSDRRAFYCEEHWPSERVRQAYGGLTASLQFVLPFFVVTFCYVNVSLKLRDRARSKPGSKNSRREEADRDRKRRTNRMLIAMVTIFGVSWMPLTIVNLTNDVYMSTGRWEYFNLCFFVVHAVAMSSTCYNPFLYAWLNDNFRKEFKQVLPCFEQSATASSAARHRSSNQCGGGRGEGHRGSGGGVAGGDGNGRARGGTSGRLDRDADGRKGQRACNGHDAGALETLLTTTTTTMAPHRRADPKRPQSAGPVLEELTDAVSTGADVCEAASYHAGVGEVHLYLGFTRKECDVLCSPVFDSL